MHGPATSLDVCPVCGARTFAAAPILWPELIEAWKLSVQEIDYINLQQGFYCTECKNNLRSMTLAAAVANAFGFRGSFEDFCRTDPVIRELVVTEINPAGNLSRFLRLLPKHVLLSFPQFDMQQMSLESESVDLIIHSDTLEHVPDVMAALRESFRVLKAGGRLFYTVPIVIGRLTSTRRGSPPSYHGTSQTNRGDLVVQTEYGADFWCEIFQAGFREVNLTSLMFPASVAIHAIKPRE